jgi:pimeloyl-ACP methyl ester carboxylesterase
MKIPILLLLGSALALTQPPAQRRPGGDSAPLPWLRPNATAASRVLARGGLEILTYESEADYDRLQELYKTTRDLQPPPGKMTPLYLQSRTDGSVQPFGVRLPLGYSPERRYPLVVQLHGLNFNEVLAGSRPKFNGMGSPQWIQPDLPVIYVQAFGRPSTFYRGMGEEDTLEVIEETERRFSVDPTRVYLMGHSMGGSGSYTIGLHFPDRFGGLMPIDAAMWTRAQASAGKAPDWMQPQIDIHSTQNLYANARNVDVFFKNAGAGIQGHSTEFADAIVEQGGFATTESFPNMPHSFGDQYPYSNFVTELIQRPIRRRPAEIKFFTNTLRYDRAYWATIDRLTRHNASARFTATYADGKALSVSTTNIDALTLRLNESPVPNGAAIPVVVDGTEVLRGGLPAVLHLSRQDGKWKVGEWKAPARTKKHGLQGPIDDAFNSKFLAVYGEGGRDLAIAELDAIRNPPGPLDVHGDFPMKPAARVTPQDIASANLILFGTPDTNPVLKRIAASLPPALLRDENGARSIFIYPNPENPSRYVVVWQAKLLSGDDATLRWAWIMPLCLLQDYVRVKDGKIVSGGHFDSDWNQRP